MLDGPNLYLYCSNNPLNWIDPFGLEKQKIDWWKWWLYESVVPGPYGQPMSEWGPTGPTEWGNPMKYTEQAGGWWKWGERVAVGTATATSVTTLGLGIAEMTGLINTAPQANNIIRIISKLGRWGFRLDKAHHGQPWGHTKFWRW